MRTTNKLAELFNIEVLREEIKNCPKDETIIILPHYSINRPQYTDDEYENDAESWDFSELEEQIGCSLMVNDYDDLICDPHGIIEF